MARILELVLIANALGGIAGYLGFRVRRAKQAARTGINKAAGKIGVEVYHEDDIEPPDEKMRRYMEGDPYRNKKEPPKKSRLARIGARLGA